MIAFLLFTGKNVIILFNKIGVIDSFLPVMIGCLTPLGSRDKPRRDLYNSIHQSGGKSLDVQPG